MAKYTSWITRLDDEQSVIEEGGRIICRMDECPCTRQRAERNLIAAAPELLEALESYLRAPSIGSDGPGSATIVVQEFNRKAARSAIAKARKED